MSFITGAYATSERTIRVTVSGNSVIGYPTTPGSSIDPANWLVDSIDTLTNYIVLSVSYAGFEVDNMYDLYTLRKFPAFPTQIRVAGPGVLGNDTLPMAGEWVFPGAAQPDRMLMKKQGPQDFQNAPLGGTLTIASSGDYANHSGAEFLQKMVLRRFTTSSDEFRHLAGKNFGLGLKVKEPIKISDLRMLKSQMEAQARMEPDVASCSVEADLQPSTGLAFFRIKIVRQSTGEEIAQTFSINDGAIQF